MNAEKQEREMTGIDGTTAAIQRAVSLTGGTPPQAKTQAAICREKAVEIAHAHRLLIERMALIGGRRPGFWEKLMYRFGGD